MDDSKGELSVSRNQILKKGGSFQDWRRALEGVLIEKKVLGFVFDDIPWQRVPKVPVRTTGESEDEYFDRLNEYHSNDALAYSLITSRLHPDISPNFGGERKSAKELFQHIESMYRPAVTINIHKAIKKLHSIKLQGSNTLKYCEEFSAAVRDYRTAVEQHCRSEMIPNRDTLEIPKLHINLLFEGGVEHAEWLRPWRLFNKPEKNDLEAMITSLRRQEPPTAGASRAYLGAPGATAAAAAEIRDDDEQCVQCRHHHTNARCFKQHPDRAPRHWTGKSRSRSRDVTKGSKHDKDESKAKKQSKKDKKESKRAAAAAIDSADSETDSISSTSSSLSSAAVLCIVPARSPQREVVQASASAACSLTSKSMILDSGTSFHFFRKKSWFKDLRPMVNPVTFTQAVGKSSITHSGTVVIKVKSKKGKTTTITLRDCLYSPQSAINLLSAGRLQKIGGLTWDTGTGAIKRKDGKEIGSARIVNDVYILEAATIVVQPEPAIKSSNESTIAAPAVSKPKADTERWHQRLGHVGSTILNATKQQASGLENIDTSALTHCETCKLSKSQRTISREPRPSPGQPLDEIHIDTVGPIVTVRHWYVGREALGQDMRVDGVATG